MTGIRSLADELRETIKNSDEVGTDKSSPVPKKTTTVQRKTKGLGDDLEKLLESILSHQLAGNEKLLIRLDDRTIFLLKQLKIAKGIDMNKLIAFSLQNFFSRHPELIQYIKDNIKTIEL
ncbi:hypothetical protein ABIB62_004351 [Mucilaginibacter sp. UYP25]|uniref:hypothetical protein n=1 Tax=unclassified Mucilaginibacter TaxID=2617802 RepID=UPI0033933E7A